MKRQGGQFAQNNDSDSAAVRRKTDGTSAGAGGTGQMGFQQMNNGFGINNQPQQQMPVQQQQQMSQLKFELQASMDHSMSVQPSQVDLVVQDSVAE